MGIAILINLVKRTAQNAKYRDKSIAGTVIYTIVLWAVFSFIGIVLSSMILAAFSKADNPVIINLLWLLLVYAFYIGFGLLGGVIADKISKKSIKLRTVEISTQEDYHNYFSDDEVLDKPCKITVIRDKDLFTMFDKYSFILNGIDLGYVNNQQGVMATTNKRKNTIRARRERGGVRSKPYEFIVPDGGEVEVHFFDKEFDNSKTRIIKGHLPVIVEEAL